MIELVSYRGGKAQPATFPIVVPAQRLVAREVVEAARRVTQPDAAETAQLRLWAGALIVGCPELAEMLRADTGWTLAKAGYSVATLGLHAYDWLTSVHLVDDNALILEGVKVLKACTAAVNAWAEQREAVLALGKP